MYENFSRVLFIISYFIILFIPILLYYYNFFIFSDYEYIWFSSKLLTLKYVIYNNTGHDIYYTFKFNKTDYFSQYIRFHKLKKLYEKNESKNNNSNDRTINNNKFITYNNFILDSEAFKKLFLFENKTEIYDIILSFLVNHGKNDENYYYDDNENDHETKIILFLFNFGLNITKRIIWRKKINNLIKYIDKKIKEEENNELNVFSNMLEFNDRNNYINFLKIDLNLYKNIFPYDYNLKLQFITLIFLIILFFIFCFEKNTKKYCLIFSLIYISIYIYYYYYLKEVYDKIFNKDLINIQNIKCNKYIQNLLIEYINLFNNIKLIPFLYYSIKISFLLQILACSIAFINY